MKNPFKILVLLLMVLFQSSCIGVHVSADEDAKNNAFQMLNNLSEFTFNAQRVYPMDISAVYNPINSMPGAIPGKVLNLDYGYSVILKKDSLSVNLPYYGRAYKASYNTNDVGFNFDSKNSTFVKKYLKNLPG